MHPNCHLQALGTAISDHYPMVMNCDPFHRLYKGFMFEAWWLQQPDFGNIVQQSWSQLVQSQNKARILHIKLARLAKIEILEQMAHGGLEKGVHGSASEPPTT
jgi:hypothetical protein